MRYGIILTSGDIHEIGNMAVEAEAAAWDGVFYWDGIGFAGAYDPWVTMASIAMRTERVRFGAIVTPPTRRRPWKLARETMTLDHLSRGRLIVPVGLGAVDDPGFKAVGEETDRRIRAEMLDESLAILALAWSGKPFSFSGRHYHVAEMAIQPAPVQQPRIPIWVVAVWPRAKSIERAFRYDGIMPAFGPPPAGAPDPDVIRAIAAEARKRKGANEPFDIVIEGITPADNAVAAREQVRPLADAGATWWIESNWEHGSVASLLERIAAGPPG